MQADLHPLPPALSLNLIRHEQLCHVFARDHRLLQPLSLSPPAFGFETLAQPCTCPMHQNSEVSDAHLKNLTDLTGVKALDLTQDEHFTLVHRQTAHAAAYQLSNLLR